jgi:aminoglycoside 6'-N-acetyltransferase I
VSCEELAASRRNTHPLKNAKSGATSLVVLQRAKGWASLPISLRVFGYRDHTYGITRFDTRVRQPGYHGSVPEVSIRPAQPSDHEQLLHFREALWPDSPTDGHARELTLILEGKPVTTLPLVIFVAEVVPELIDDPSDRTLAGFLEVDLRSHADGCNPSRPVGYIEGWYVAENHRHEGIGKKLLAAAEDWARNQGCVEVASDTWIDNEVSQRAHEALGYEVVDRCVHYRKKL